MGLHSEAEIDRKFIAFAKLMNIYLNHFPAHEKYGISLEIRQAMYSVYGLIVECQKRYHKKTTITARQGKVESVISILGHARQNHTLKYLLTTLRDKYHAINIQLPKIYHPRCNAYAQVTR